MSIDSALIIDGAKLPETSALAKAIADAGARIEFPDGFRLDRDPAGWTAITLDGETSGFDYGVEPVADLIGSGELPAEIAGHGDTLLSFGGRGTQSVVAVAFVTNALVERWGAWGVIEGELVPPDEMVCDPRAYPALVAGLAERAAAERAEWFAKNPPPPPERRPSTAIDWIVRALWLLAAAAVIFMIYRVVSNA